MIKETTQKVKTISILDKAASHYNKLIKADMVEIDVPEWNDKIYYRKTFSFAEQGKVFELSNEGKMVEALVHTLIVRSLDKDGNKLFTVADKPRLMYEVDPSIIIRIVTEINEDVEETLVAKKVS